MKRINILVRMDCCSDCFAGSQNKSEKSLFLTKLFMDNILKNPIYWNILHVLPICTEWISQENKQLQKSAWIYYTWFTLFKSHTPRQVGVPLWSRYLTGLAIYFKKLDKYKKIARFVYDKLVLPPWVLWRLLRISYHQLVEITWNQLVVIKFEKIFFRLEYRNEKEKYFLSAINAAILIYER